MTIAHGLLLLTAALAVYGVGQVWMVQLSSYPLWTHVGRGEFRAYHLAWWHSIWGVILLPAGLLTLCAFLMLHWRDAAISGWMIWTGLGLQVALVLGTAFRWAPLMARLEGPEGGLLVERYRLLLKTHWLRVLIVTAYGAIALWMLSVSAWP